LLSATIGELNKEQYAAWFERRLKHLLHYATTWKAIVLFDEADVFLEGRSDAPGVATEQNALVAVFLKHLEYFSGIVFLTSNRVGVFDQAMKSRIHLALEYQPPDVRMRERIWQQCLGAVPEEEMGMDLEEDLEYFLRDDVNGREIANCVNTARTLARFKSVKLGKEHILTVLKTRSDFDKSLVRLKAKNSKSGTTAGRKDSILETLRLEDE
jgi:SpoVK/Ycf46/Vps4 family AAA+-type ATPase